MIQFRTREELEAAVPWIQQSPKTGGRLEMIVIRPAEDQRTVVESAGLSIEEGLTGDNWQSRGSRRTEDGSAHPEMQITLMNARAAQVIAQDRERWPLAGDQLYVDLDLSALEPGQRLRIGSALLEITGMLHSGCRKFSDRFGQEALRWVNSPEGRQMRLRGIYARVVRTGTIRTGDPVEVC